MAFIQLSDLGEKMSPGGTGPTGPYYSNGPCRVGYKLVGAGTRSSMCSPVASTATPQPPENSSFLGIPWWGWATFGVVTAGVLLWSRGPGLLMNEIAEDYATLAVAEKLGQGVGNIAEGAEIEIPGGRKVVATKEIIEEAAQIAGERQEHGFGLTESERAAVARSMAVTPAPAEEKAPVKKVKKRKK